MFLILKEIADFSRISLIFYLENNLKIQLDSFIDFEKCCKMRIWMGKSVSIQPRTSLGKSDVSWRVPAAARAAAWTANVRVLGTTGQTSPADCRPPNDSSDCSGHLTDSDLF